MTGDLYTARRLVSRLRALGWTPNAPAVPDYDRQTEEAIAQALREARAEGMEAAAAIAERHSIDEPAISAVARLMEGFARKLREGS